ncbi:hypothetical protein [Rhodopseudomonas palustris]|uniref:Transmembrane protein n=1 Tax=Rhodopseudomonas palustris (strain BisB18) TaxID=316056 RepID=Q213C8_RHOPB
MIRTLHPIAGIIGFLTILGFWLSTVVVELGGDPGAIAAVKLGILWGLAVLIPALATAGLTGFKLGGKSQRPEIVSKRLRMPIIAFNGVVVLVPCAVMLQRQAAAGQFDRTFIVIQALELLAGAVNITLLGLSIRDGLKLARRFGVAAT